MPAKKFAGRRAATSPSLISSNPPVADRAALAAGPPALAPNGAALEGELLASVRAAL